MMHPDDPRTIVRHIHSERMEQAARYRLVRDARQRRERHRWNWSWTRTTRHGDLLTVRNQGRTPMSAMDAIATTPSR